MVDIHILGGHTILDSSIICEALIVIPNGHIHYHTVDTTKVQPGDMATYSCDTLYTLSGPQYRVCLRNASWTETEPKCIRKSTKGCYYWGG